jgi:hypothetical protein
MQTTSLCKCGFWLTLAFIPSGKENMVTAIIIKSVKIEYTGIDAT